MKSLITKTIKFIIFFLIFTLIINALYVFIIIKTDWNFAKRIESLRFDNPDYELLVFGSSLADYGVDTEYLTRNGIKSFNFAIVGSSVKTNYIQLEEYLTKYSKRPEYVVLFVNSSFEDFTIDGIQPVVEFTMKGQKINLSDIPVSKFQWQRTELLKKLFSKEYREGYTSYGQTRRNKIQADHSEYTNKSLEIEDFESAYWISRMSELCDKKDIEFLVIEIPGENEYQNISDIGPYTLQFKNGTSAKLYNLNNQKFCKFIDPKKDWVGLSHFNKSGAEKFTHEFIHVTGIKIQMK